MKSLVLSFLMALAFLQRTPREIIIWEAGQKLAWADFKGTPKINSNAVAVTSSGIGYKLITRTDQGNSNYEVVVFAYFSTQDSWYKPKYVNDNVLAHEQLHFDITALYAQKLIYEIGKLSFNDDVELELEKMHDRITIEMDSVQKAYDKQTESSVHESAQVLWQSKIEGKLKKYLKLNSRKR
ncbi:hypothetical protein MQE36_00520 [Zhouia spongiae]|uniref:DUF922 domain-containing protein n=1 Tax=Zhouia spongiae TaxID=2202721 RepID=A0ABY3YNX4_9FLAO|nr:hypothetical protein [Zhouia spongiae]UNY98853.1 hypothetical protein MQE36_00520 [Zhouia spongiae]